MSESEPIRSKGTTDYDLKGMPDEDFEAMVGRLVLVEFPNAFKPSNTLDGGADMVLPREGEGYERCWQAKHYPGKIHWAECEKSLADALKNWEGIAEYTFAFPRDLTSPEQKTFDKKFRGSAQPAEVNHWNGTALQARLRGSEEGQRVATTFFDPGFDREAVERAMAAGGPLQTPEDALERLGTVGSFLADSDSYFSYPTSTHETGQPGPSLTPGSIMSLGESDEKITRRIDVVPRDEEAAERYGPEFVLSASEGEAGRAAAAKLEEALREGKAVEIGEGIDLTVTRAPPALKGLVGTRFTGGRLSVGKAEKVRRRVPPFVMRMEAVTDRGRAHIEVQLHQADSVPEGWDEAFAGEFGPMRVAQLSRQEGDKGMARWNFNYRRDSSPARLQLEALHFLSAASGVGEIVLTRPDIEDFELRSPSEPKPVDPAIKALIAFLEDIREIELWTGVEYQLPDEISAEDAKAIRHMAATLRAGGTTGTWSELNLEVQEPGLEQLRAGGVFRIELPATFPALGREVPIGLTRVDLSGFEIASIEPKAEGSGTYDVSLRPKDSEAAQIFEAIVKEPTEARPVPGTGASAPASARPKKAEPGSSKSQKKQKKRSAKGKRRSGRRKGRRSQKRRR